ncbi:MAG: EAL domain-containing protein [Pseudomonadota bacterium]
MVWFSYYTYQSTHIAHLRGKAETLARFVSAVSPDRIFSHDFSTLHTYAREVSRERDIVYAVIIGSRGEPLTSYLNAQDIYVSTAIRAVGSRDTLKIVRNIQTQPDIVAVQAPVNFSREEIGQVLIGATRKRVDAETLRVIVWNALGGALMITLLSLGTYYVFRRHVLRPTALLMSGAQRVAKGDLSSVIPVTSSDELGLLAQSFNEMVSDLQHSDKERVAAIVELQELNRTLEMRVEERTHAIEVVNRQLEKLALYDALTGLPNRSLIGDRLDFALKTSQHDNVPFSVMIMDLDRFKEVNDTLGHDAGDELLKEVGRRLTVHLHRNDTIGRLGGDEFAIILPNISDSEATIIATRIGRLIQEPIPVAGLSVMIAASLGIACYPEGGEDVATLMKNADIAMYQAKENKTGHCVYRSGINIHSRSRLALMGDLRHTIENDDLILHYQPIIELSTRKTRGFEALARWPHPKYGYVSPEHFVPIAEQMGLMRAFSYRVLDCALAQLKKWRYEGMDVTVSVNLSMRNLHDKEFPEQLEKLLQKWSVAPGTLVLEITESSMMNDPQYVLQALQLLRELKVNVAIDDFGTGYSSLTYLKRLPVQEIKIDRSFIRELVTNKDDATIVPAIIDLAHNLGLRVVAEGVQDEATLSVLRYLGCDLAQGFHIGRPVAPSDAVLAVPLRVGRGERI